MNKNVANYLALLLLLIAPCYRSWGQSSTNVMPAGFTNVQIGMTTNALSQVQTNTEWRSQNALPSTDASETILSNAFFDSVGYDFKGSNSLLVVTFYAADYEKYKSVMPGFVKGCIQKYGTDYEKRFIKGLNDSAFLRWTKGDAVIVAEFVTESYSNSHKTTTKGGEVLYPYMLRIFKANIQHPQVDEYQNSLPHDQDSTGLLFQNFPAFLDNYTGPIWQ
jgi:hypothetical protein